MIVSILYTLFPLKEIYVGVLSAMLWDMAKAALARRRSGRSEASFLFLKVAEDSQTLKRVRGVTGGPEIIKGLVRRTGRRGASTTTSTSPFS